MPANPKIAGSITEVEGEHKIFGISVDGVLFEPGAREFWRGNQDWRYEPLGGALNLGLDENHAHVQPSGMYHYHGLPTGLMNRLGFAAGKHSPMIGWAADGFPIYVKYGFGDPLDSASKVTELKSSYRLKSGNRPSGSDAPGGKYDGAFVADYEFVEGTGDLDECNGRQCVTPEFPEGTYAYFLTEDWPVIPRAFRGVPSNLGGLRAQREHPHGRLQGRPPPPPRPPFPR